MTEPCDEGQANAERARKRRQDGASIEHRRHLVACEQKSQEEFDKTLVVLSGGALAISFGFVENFIGPNGAVAARTLFGAWICWASSLTAVLCSFLLSVKALRRAKEEFDEGLEPQKPGGWFAWWLSALNFVGPVLFVIGLLLMFSFINQNLERNHEQGTKTNATTTETGTGTRPETNR